MSFLTINNERLPIIVTDFDLTRRSNLVFHVIGDDYKVSSYGDPIFVKKINGMLRNPEVRIGELIDFYFSNYIGSKYGEPSKLNYLNYSGEGYITGMVVSYMSGQPANVSLDYLETSTHNLEIEADANNSAQDVPDNKAAEDYYERPEDSCWLLLTIQYNDGGFAMTRIPVNGYTISMGSRYSIINSRKNMIYFGDNPSQLNMLYTITNDDGRYKEFWVMRDILKVSRSVEATFITGKRMWPVTVAQIVSQDASSNTNYLTCNITAMMGKMI